MPSENTQYKYIDLGELSDENINQNIVLDGRIQNARCKKNISFIVIRKGIHTIQCILDKNNGALGEQKYKEMTDIPMESYVALRGKLNKLPETVSKIQSCSYDQFEFLVDDYELISKSYSNKLPFQMNDTSTLLSTKLDNRSYDLRAPLNKCIFKLQSGICELFREYLLKNKFMEIHTPKLIGVASEGGSQVFPVKYFDKSAYLAQSPQLYKQMCINSDFERVFEIGSIFRAENSISHRHLTEFTGLDVELALPYGESYEYILKLLWLTVHYIYTNIKIKCREEYEYIKENTNFEELIFPHDPLIIDFKEGVRLLKENGYAQNSLEDLSTENEKKLGEIVKSIYGSDVFILNKYPTNVRPFYTMPCNNDKNYSNSYDMIMRGEEICSGAQRVHDYMALKESLFDRNIKDESLSDYLQSFMCGSVPHGGFGLGLERVLMLILDTKNVRKCSLYPRDPHRLTP